MEKIERWGAHDGIRCWDEVDVTGPTEEYGDTPLLEISERIRKMYYEEGSISRPRTLKTCAS